MSYDADQFEAHWAKITSGSSYYSDPNDRWENIQELCVCGHLKMYHGQQIGGEYGGEDYKFGRTSAGCVGASPNRSHPEDEFRNGLMVRHPTCPCPKYRGVAEIDRPGRYFMQKVYTKNGIHPFILGLQAQRNRLMKSKAYGDHPGKPGTWREEAARRFTWIKGKRKCRVCGSTGDDVWPAFVNEQRLSQMRCDEHREFPTAEAP